MSDTSELYAEVQRGSYAQQIISNPLWKDAHTQWQSDLTLQLKTLAADPAACQQIAFLLLAGDKFHQYLADIAQTGQFAAVQLDQLYENR
jgi:hypothetical protein